MGRSKPDHWSSKVSFKVQQHRQLKIVTEATAKAYTNAASFVPALTTKVLQYLDPQPEDIILDIGCGDGVLTAKIAPLCKAVMALDNSPSFIEAARLYVKPAHANIYFYEHDCSRLPDGLEGMESVLMDDSFDKIFSNAAMHWILRRESTRLRFFKDIFRVLRPGGLFVFEQGGAGNVAEVHTATTSVLHHGFNIPLERIRKADPWFFPSDAWMQQMLEKVGFDVEKVELEYRPTRLNPDTADGTGGLQGWVELMCASFLDLLKTDEDKQNAIGLICEVLEDVVSRGESEGKYLGYVRLRAVARKPVQ